MVAITAIVITVIIIYLIPYLIPYSIPHTYSNVLISVVTIDRDADLIMQVSQPITKLMSKGADLLVVCRESDIQCRELWNNVGAHIVTVPDYSINGRHNYQAIANKRNIAKQYAKDYSYDYLFFIDSDIVIRDNTLDILLDGNADVCMVPYEVKWLGYPAVGVKDGAKYKIQPVTSGMLGMPGIPGILEILGIVSYGQCAIGGMGCTLIKYTVYDIPFEYRKIEGFDRDVYGEDIGFFMNAFDYDIRYVKNHSIQHLLG
jgi:hypothetical protein